MAHVCCSTGACRSVPYWPVEAAQDGWLQLDHQQGSEVPVDLIAFSSRGVSVTMDATQSIRQGSGGILITQAHGAGCRYQRVVCCWHRLHPHDPQRQCVGLRFDHPAPEPPCPA